MHMRYYFLLSYEVDGWKLLRREYTDLLRFISSNPAISSNGLYNLKEPVNTTLLSELLLLYCY